MSSAYGPGKYQIFDDDERMKLSGVEWVVSSKAETHPHHILLGFEPYLGSPKAVWAMKPAEARRLAMRLLKAAELKEEKRS